MMTKYKIQIELKTYTIVGSAEGYKDIDTDIIFDSVGIPYIPSKRVKGLLLDSARELNEFYEAKFDNIKYPDNIFKIFGEKGMTNNKNSFFISNLQINDYEQNRETLNNLIQNTDIEFSKENVLNYFTTIRTQTSIGENGISKDTSLHKSRVLKKEITKFSGEIEFNNEYENFMNLVCKNTKKMGVKRNRGFGKIKVKLLNF